LKLGAATDGRPYMVYHDSLIDVNLRLKLSDAMFEFKLRLVKRNEREGE